MSNNGSYANEKPPTLGDPEVGSDPASGGFFVTDYKKHEDLKAMLDSNKDGLKLEAMKRTIGMVAKGKDASDLFPAVVKNVVSKNIEVKKLVYVYLVRYAEEQQDLALLSISTFQRGLKDPNQLIRASALRVLSSIRVPVIVPIMMLAIKESVNDMSPYVRRAAAHAIPKLYSLDPEQKEQLIEVIEKLLSDKTTLVVGSAVMAFEEVCPERIDLIHKNYRKLCNLLVDVEEWGQVVIINMLTRYARTQFLDPNKNEFIDENDVKSFYDSGASETEEPKKKPYVMDPDHRLLLRNCKPLLQSRNAAVVMAVAQLYHYLAPKSEVSMVSKALVRLLRSHREVQSVVLCNIATMSTKRRGMFEPFLKSFFVRSSDATHIKLLKLEILTNLVTETSSSTILREFQTYVSSSDKEFVAATIQAIGRCASNISEVTDTCLNGLVSLMSNRDEAVVAESVVVIKKLLQMRPTEHKDIIIHMAKLVDSITVPMARASILWLLGEYSDRVPKIAPDVLRKMAKTFIQEEDIVKLQILNLATKLFLTNSKQTRLLCQYVFNLAKYDQNYDIRDRARFLRQMIFPSEKCGVLAKQAKKIFLATKPAPVLESKFKDRDQFQLGTLSHYINSRAYEYHDLPEFPETMPDPSVRNVEVTLPWTDSRPIKKKMKKKSFYSESESSSAVEESQNEESSSGSDSESSSSSSASSESASSGSESEDEDQAGPGTKKDKKKATKSDESSSEEEESSSEESSESEEDSDDSVKVNKKKKIPTNKTDPLPTQPTSDLLLDFDDNIGTTPNVTPLLQSHSLTVLSPSLPNQISSPLTEKLSTIPPVLTPVYLPSFTPIKQHELLNRITGNGLTINYRFTRNQHLFSSKMVSLEVTFTNNSESQITNIKVGEKKLLSGMELHSFAEIGSLDVNSNSIGTLGIDFCDSMQPANFEICAQNKNYNVSIVAPVGELLHGGTTSEMDFLTLQKKLGGMNENSTIVDLPNSNITSKIICSRVLEAANVAQINTTDESAYRFAAETLSSQTLVLVTIKLLDNQKVTIIVNCEKMVIGSMLVKEIKAALVRS